MGFYLTISYFFILLVCFPLSSWFDKIVVLSYFYERGSRTQLPVVEDFNFDNWEILKAQVLNDITKSMPESTERDSCSMVKISYSEEKPIISSDEVVMSGFGTCSSSEMEFVPFPPLEDIKKQEIL